MGGAAGALLKRLRFVVLLLVVTGGELKLEVGYSKMEIR